MTRLIVDGGVWGGICRRKHRRGVAVEVVAGAAVCGGGEIFARRYQLPTIVTWAGSAEQTACA